MQVWPSLSRLGRVWIAAAVAAFVLPLAAASVFSFVPSKRYEATAFIIVDAARGSQAISTGDDRRAGNEVITYDQVLKTQLSIAGSEDVIRRALADMGGERLYPEIPASDVPPTTADQEYAAAKGAITLSVEPNTFIMKIGFRHKDPALAAKFANQLAAEFLARRSSIYSNQGFADFFKGQEVRFNDELKVASAALERFGNQNGVYAVAEQRKLLLEARAAAVKDAADNATQIAKAESELASLRFQLGALRRRTTLPPEIYGDPGSNAATGATATQKPSLRREDSLSDDPPLLNIRIYQESAAKLVTMNAEFAGLKATEALRAGELKRLDDELSRLALNEARFNSLRRSVAQAEGYIESLSKRAGEARINDAWRSNEAFSSAQILQAATVPLGPVSPRPAVTLAAGLLVGLFLAGAILYVAATRGAEEPAVRENRPAELRPFETLPNGRPVRDAEYHDAFTAAARRRGIPV